MTLEDGKKLVALLSDNEGSFCTCEVCIKDYCDALAKTFPELQWDYDVKIDQSCEGILTVKEIS